MREVADTFREKDIPCDVIYLDIEYMDKYKVFTWDHERFPNEKRTLENLKNQGFKVVTIIDPGVKKEKGYFVYDEGIKNNYFVTDKDGITYYNQVWPGDSVFPDFSDRKVREWWAQKHITLLESGVAGIWNDMNEPASFKGPLPDEIQFKNDGRYTDHTEIHNIYGHLMSKSTFEGIKSFTGKRPFVVTRACYAGTQKYSTVWTGDNQSFWDHLRMAIPMLLNLGLSGMAFAGTDVGGFSFDTTPELLSRWVQVGCFSPLFRNHANILTRDQEPWAFDEQTLSINRKYIKLRYKLIPYLYDLMWQCENSGLPVMRPLVLQYSQDTLVHELNDEFLLGDHMLVAPVVEQGRTYRAVYLPQEHWFDYWTKESIHGGKIIIRDAPLDVCPIFIKAGSIIPNYPEQSYIGEKDINELTLDIYPGNGEYQHYQDDGESFNYKAGEYNLYRFTMYNDGEVVINIEKLASRYSKNYTTIKMIYNSEQVQVVYYNGKPIDFEKLHNAIQFIIPATEGIIKIG